MEQLNLQPNEGVIMSFDNVAIQGKNIGTYTVVLTNLNLYCVRKGFLGGTKEIRTYPLGEIKVIDGKPQVRATGSVLRGDSPSVEIYMLDGQLGIGFSTRREAHKLADGILAAVGGDSGAIGDEEYGLLPEAAAAVAGTLRDTIGAFGKGLGGRAGAHPIPKAAASQPVAQQCKSCGASLSGFSGQLVRCMYCGTEQTL